MMRKWRLCRVFRSETGMSPIQYLRSVRMERARELLQTSFLSVREIARQAGLGDHSHFSRDFKRTYGSTPTLNRNRFFAASVKNLTRRVAFAARPANRQQNGQRKTVDLAYSRWQGATL